MESKPEPEGGEFAEAIPFRKVLFWLTYGLGIVFLVLSWLLSQVPRPSHGANLGGDFAFRSCAAATFLVTVLLGRWVWRIRNPFYTQHSSMAVRLALCTAWIGLLLAFVGLIGIVDAQLFWN